ncbi:MAG: hypothetical protein HPY79_11820 [Bacteroidales bacterium]|nr:hypothetical protein [Bacteroidales bacterium]
MNKILFFVLLISSLPTFSTNTQEDILNHDSASIMLTPLSASHIRWKDWDYKGYIGITPVYLNTHSFSLGFGAEGEFALPKMLSFRANFSRNYFELDKSGKKPYMLDLGISFHPIEWIGNASYSESKVNGAYQISYDGGQTWHDRDATIEHTSSSDESIKRICFRAGIMNYRYNFTEETKYHGDVIRYVKSSALYVGLSYYKVGLGKSQRRSIMADFFIQKGVDVPTNPLISDTCTMQKGVRVCYVRAGDTGGGTYEFGFLPGLNSKSYIYFKISLTINAVFTKGFKW